MSTSFRPGAARPVLEFLEGRILLSSEQMVYYLPPQHDLVIPGEYLTGPSAAPALEIAMGYLSSHADDLGVQPEDVLHSIVTDQYSTADTGLTHIYLRQEFNGLEVVNANFVINIAADGRVLSAGGGFVGGLAAMETADSSPRQAMLSASAALDGAAAWLGLATDSPHTVVQTLGGPADSATLMDSTLSLDPIPAQLYYVATPDGVRLAWNLVLRTPDGDHWYDMGVDADGGQVLLASDWVDEASYTVYALPTEMPDDGGRTVVTDPYDPTASPYGWHDTNGASGAEYTDTRGNNVSAQDDWDNNNTGGARPDGGAGLAFNYTIDLGQDPHNYVNAAVTNLFYWNNVSHDIYYRYGFTEAAGNFQVNNYGHGGIGNDAVQADAQDGGGMNNANFATPPDGLAPRMQMYEFDMTTPHRDGDLDNMIIVHEYGHGVSNRIVGGPSNVNALDGLQSGGMGEGWSDWWGLMFTQKATDTQAGSYSVGTYVIGQPITGAGIRRQPYSYNMTIDPQTYGSYNSSNEVHDSGEIWASVLWDLNWLLINRYGYSPNIAGGYTAGGAGNLLALQLVMDSLAIMPVNPTFLDGRDAILQADLARTGGANQDLIWQAFARRGMGYSAYDGGSADATTVVQAFDLPSPDPIVFSHTPTGSNAPGVSSMNFTFSEPMWDTSFTIADDVAAFIGPDGTNIKPQINGFTWLDSRTLRITFAPQSAVGMYEMVIGPQILAYDNHNPMNQDRDTTLGEVPADRYSGSFNIIAVAYQANMDANPGWTFDAGTAPYQWQYGQPTGNAGDPTSGHTGTNVVGYNLSGAYPDNMSATQYATTPSFSTVGYQNVKLSFWRWLGVESSLYDHASIQAWDGTTWTTVWNHSTGTLTDSGWTKYEYTLPASCSNKPAVRIRWGMGPTDVSVTYEGWNIDDVLVFGDQTGSGPDLAGTAFGATPDNLRGSGGLATASFTVTNLGDAAAGAFDVQFYLSDDATISPASDILLTLSTSDPSYDPLEPEAYHISGLAASANRAGSVSLVVPTADPFGTDSSYYIGMFVDADANVTEANEANNRNRGEGIDMHNVVYLDAIYFANMDTNPGWTAGGQWAFGHPTGGGGTSYGNPDPANGYNGSNVYGVNLAGDYSTTVGGPYYVTTGPMNCSGYTGVRLAFMRWLNTDYLPFVNATVDVSNNGTTWTNIYTNPSGTPVADNAWQSMSYDISAVADGRSTVYLRWGYQVLQSAAYAYSGWNIDDVLVSGTRIAPVVDLAGTAFGVTPYNLRGSGGLATASFTVANLGDAAAGAFDVQFYLSDDATIDPAADILLNLSPTDPAYDPLEPEAYHVAGLAGYGSHAGSVSLAVPTADPFGTDASYYIGMFVDADANVTEANEANNRNRGDGIDLRNVLYVYALYWANMDTNPGWVFDSGTAPYRWQWGQPTGGGSHGLDPTSGHTGLNVIGYNLSGDYPDNMASIQYASTPSFSTVGCHDVKLSFWRWLGVESSTNDHASIQVWDGTVWTTLWDHSGAAISDTGWARYEYTLPTSLENKPIVRLRWGMGATNGSVTYPGWNIDDVLVSATPSVSADPAGISLDPLSDTGRFDYDKITRLDNRDPSKVLQFQVGGTVSGATVTIYADGIAIGSATAPSGSTTLVTTDGQAVHDLVDGTHTVTARQTESGKLESGNSPQLTMCVDTLAPTAGVPDLNPGSDTGSYPDDNITQGNSPQFDGTAGDPSSGGYASGIWKVVVGSDDGKSGLATGSPYSVVLPTLNEGSRAVAATAYDVAGNQFTTAPLALTVDRTAPRITAFGLSSSNALWILGTVDSTLWTAGRSAATAPWSRINRFVLNFGENVVADAADMTLVGSNVGPVSLTGPSGSGTGQLTWNSAAYLSRDRYQVRLASGATGAQDIAGNVLDGDGTPGVFPSGNGTPGGDWLFDLNVLVADVDVHGDGVVNTLDKAKVSLKYGTVRGDPLYSALVDINGDGVINVLDKAQASLHFGETLPAPLRLTWDEGDLLDARTAASTTKTAAKPKAAIRIKLPALSRTAR